MLNKEIKLCPFRKMQINCGSDGGSLELSQKSIEANPDRLACAHNAKIIRERFEKCDGKDCMAFNEANNRCNLIVNATVSTETYIKTSEGEKVYNCKESTNSFEMSKDEILGLACIKSGVTSIISGYISYVDEEQIYENLCNSESKSVVAETKNILISCQFFKYTSNGIYRFECHLYQDRDVDKLIDSYIATIDRDNITIEDSLSVRDSFNWKEVEQ